MKREDEIRARLEKATPGPWRTDVSLMLAGVNDVSNPYWKPSGIEEDKCYWCNSYELLGIVVRNGANYHVHANLPDDQTIVSVSALETVIPDCAMKEDDIQFIANAPADIDYLLTCNENLRGNVQKVEAWNNRLCEENQRLREEAELLGRYANFLKSIIRTGEHYSEDNDTFERWSRKYRSYSDSSNIEALHPKECDK